MVCRHSFMDDGIANACQMNDCCCESDVRVQGRCRCSYLQRFLMTCTLLLRHVVNLAQPPNKAPTTGGSILWNFRSSPTGHHGDWRNVRKPWTLTTLLAL